jgi:hypothetical protein
MLPTEAFADGLTFQRCYQDLPPMFRQDRGIVAPPMTVIVASLHLENPTYDKRPSKEDDRTDAIDSGIR